MKAKLIAVLVMTLLIGTVFSVAGTGNVEIKRDRDDNKCFDYDISNPAFSPGLITIKIVAKVSSVDDSDNLLGGAINVGDTITGKYIYDDMTPDTNPLPTVGDYQHSSPSCGIEVNAGGFVFTTDPSNVNFLVEICNDHGSPTPRDNYLLRSYNNLHLSNGMLVDHISWQLDDDTCTALSSTALPTTAPVLANWQSLFGLVLRGSDPSDPFKDYFIRAHVTSATKTRARNIPGPEEISMPRNILLSNTLFLRLLERFPNMFPILQKLLFQRLD